jgi:hypothetical protein
VLGLKRDAIHVFDYGAPVGNRLAMARAERISAIIAQNGNAYEEGLSGGWASLRIYWADPTPAHRGAIRPCVACETTRWQYVHGVPDPSRVAPGAHTLDAALLQRPGVDEIQRTCSSTIVATWRCTRRSTTASPPGSRRCWRQGAATIRTSCRQAPKPTGAASRTPRCTRTTRATSR